MTRARNGAAGAAPTRAIAWHLTGDDDDRGPSRTFPRCDDGDELLARTTDGRVVEVTVDRRHGTWLRGPDGEHVEAEAIAERPRRSSTQTEASRRAAGMSRLTVRITAEQRRRLQWISDTDGHDLATIVGCHIDQEWDERAGERQTGRPA